MLLQAISVAAVTMIITEMIIVVARGRKVRKIRNLDVPRIHYPNGKPPA